MRPGEEEVYGPPPLLEEVIQDELVDVQAASCALARCQQFNSYDGLQNLVNAAQEELRLANEPRLKRYLFSYLEQLRRVMDLVRCQELPKTQ